MNTLEFRFAFFARNFQKSVDFYRNALGMKYIGGWDREDGKGALLSAGGTAVVEIRVENASAVDQFHQRLAGQGAERIESPQDHPWGHRSFVIYDPDGIPVHIYCELE